MRHLRAGFYLAAQVGAGLAERQVLFPAVSQRAAELCPKDLKSALRPTASAGFSQAKLSKTLR